MSKGGREFAGTPRVAPDTISTHHTHIDGLEIVAREIATGPHPRWGMKHPAVWHYITKLLLEDESEQYACNHCGLTDPNLLSIRNHLSAHSDRPTRPLTPEATVRAVLREVAKARRIHGVARYAGPAAAALNKAGVRPAHNNEWTPQSVSSLYNRWGGVYKMASREPKPQPPLKAAKEKPANPVTSSGQFSDLVGYVGAEKALLIQARDRLQDLLNLVEQMIDAPPPPPVVDQELVEKAAKWDQARGLFG